MESTEEKESIEKLKRNRWWLLIAGVLLVIAGVLYLNNPVMGTLILIQVIGVIFIVVGAIFILSYWMSHSAFKSMAQVVLGLLHIIMGIFFLMYTVASAVSLSYLVSFWVLFSGVIQITTSLDAKRFGMRLWWLDLLSGLLGVVVGFMLIGNGMLTGIYITLMVSIYFIFHGAELVVLFFDAGFLAKRLEEEVSNR